jgi:DNA/RNA endonuclease YhcR with UshA esterase domain
MGLGKEGAASAALFDPHLSSWRPYELAEGETVAGVVLRLPAAGTFNGSRLFVRTEHGTLAVRATAKSGHTALGNLLERPHVRPGDRVAVTFTGWGTTAAVYSYRNYEVTRR